MRVPSGPKERFPLQHLVEYLRDPLRFLSKVARDYGGIARLKIAGAECCLVSDPQCIELVLRTRHEEFIKGKVIWRSPDRLLHRFWASLGRPPVGSQIDRYRQRSEFWRKQRQVILPAFQIPRVRDYDTVIIDETERMLDCWRNQQTCDLCADLIPVTLNIASRALFGLDLGPAAASVSRDLDTLIDSYLTPAASTRAAKNRLAEATQRLDQIVYSAIHSRRNSPRYSEDLLSRFMAFDQESDVKASDRTIRDEIITVLLSGHKTVALLVAYACYLLLRHPKASQRFTQQSELLTGRWFTAPPDAPEFRYADQIMRETLRLYPPAWMIEREPLQNCEIGGYDVRAGTQLLLSAWIVHRDPRLWDSPDSFQPERWAAPILGRLPRGAYFPFGMGPQTCVAEYLTLRAAILILSSIFRRFRLELVSGQPIKLLASETLRPRDGLKVLVQACGGRMVS